MDISRTLNVRLHRWAWLLLLLAAFLKNAFAAAIAPFPAVDTCEISKTVYIVNHGLHTGIVVNREDLIALVPVLAKDFMAGNYVEIGWGDAKFYQARVTSVFLAIQAIFWPGDAVLHVVAIQDAPYHYFPDNVTIVELSLPQDSYQKLLAFIADTFAYTNTRQVEQLGPGLYGNSYFYRAMGEFHAFNTCNTWIARSLEAAGYPISSHGVMTARGLLSRLRSQKMKEAEATCSTLRSGNMGEW
jgi:uncharacterized protein (TIGR02117 family)